MMWILNRIFLILVLTVLEIYGLDEPCDQNLNCTGNAICIGGTCACDQVSYQKAGKCSPYVTEYKGYCREDLQCTWLGDNAECHNNTVCICKESYRWYQGKCQYFVGKEHTCQNDLECFDGVDLLALKCDSSTETCVCNDGYSDRGSDCRKSSQVNGDCAINYDCRASGTSNLVCHLGKCVPSANSVHSIEFLEQLIDDYPEEMQTKGNNILYDESDKISCSRDSDCKNMANSVCDATTFTCKCTDASYFLYEGNCLPGFRICSEDTDCTSFMGNTHCFQTNNNSNGVCICKPGYFYYKNVCTPELGMQDSNLKKDTDCSIKPAKFQDSTCYCKDYWFGDDTNRNCIKTTLQQTQSCLTNEWCNAMGPNSFCNASNLCQCSSFSTLNEKTFYCEGNRPEGICLRDSDCGNNERCQYEKCTCIEHYSYENEACLPDLGGSCERDTHICSHVENSICLDNTCRCNMNYVDYNNACLKMADNWDDECEVSEQCQNLTFSKCSPINKKCICIHGYERKDDDKCWESKDYGDPCMNSEQCTKVLNSYYECRNSQCLCPIGKTLENFFCVINSSTTYFLSSSVLILSFLFGAFVV